MTYLERLKDPRWQKKRLEVFQRDNFTCQFCGAENKTLHVHHCHYEKGDPWKTRTEFLLTLCEKCHERRQSLENDGRLILGHLYAGILSLGELQDFIASLASYAGCEFVGYSPLIVERSRYDEESWERWVRYAKNNPEARHMVESVLETRFNWDSPKSRNEYLEELLSR